MEETKSEQINLPFKKDLILRQKLAIQRTFLANQSTFLSFLRSSMYFWWLVLVSTSLLMVTRRLFLNISCSLYPGFYSLWALSTISATTKKIKQSKIHIGDYKFKYENK